MIEPTEFEMGQRVEWFTLNTSHSPASAGRWTRHVDEETACKEARVLVAVSLPILRVIRRVVTNEDVALPKEDHGYHHADPRLDATPNTV